MTIDNYANWQNLTDEKYQEKKKAVADAIVASLESYLPGVSAHIEVLEVGTPRTIERFASLPEGAIYGLAQNVTQASLNRLSQNTIVKGLFLAGAWTRPGCGVHGCLVSGKDAADLAVKYLK
jgi:phytoene dehydrogenase-like protein